MKCFFAIVVLFACSQWVRAQSAGNEESAAIHVRVGPSYLIHYSSISNFEGVSDCSEFTRGTSLVPQISVGLERRISTAATLSLAARYSSRSTTLLADQSSVPAFNVSLSSQTSVLFESSITATLPCLDIVPEVALDLHMSERSKFRLLAGAVVGIALSPTFETRQRIVSPDNAVFVSNKQQSISLSNGTQAIRSISSPLLGVSIGVDNLMTSGANAQFTQALRFEYLLNDIVSTATWKAMGVRFDIGYRFGFMKEHTVSPAPTSVPTPAPVAAPTPVITQKFEAASPLPILRTRIEALDLTLQTGNELRASLPLVNAVFFALNSAKLADRYSIRESDLVKTDDAVEHHRNILLSIVRILSANPRSTIILEGSTSGNDEQAGVALAKERAENVMSALRNMGIASTRMSVRSAVLPRIPSNSEFPQGREENRRVDIIVKDAPLQEYVSRQQFASLRGTMRYTVDAQNFKSGVITVQTNLGNEQSHMMSESRTIQVDERVSGSDRSYPVYVEARAGSSLTDRADTTVDVSSLRREVINLDLSSFEAWLRFDYNSSVLSDDNKDLLRQLLQALPSGSTISLIGSADALGDEASNLQLSAKRAAATESFIKSVAANRFTLETSVSKDKVTESVAEGRFLNRSIRIRVR